MIENNNENYFINDSTDKYYLLGLLFSDGFLLNPRYGRQYAMIKLIDEQILKDINLIMGKNELPKKVGLTSAGNQLYRISFSNSELIDELKKLGLHERKTFTIKYPDIPNKYHSDFIRGVFDGDGCIHISKRKGRENSYMKEFSILGTFDLLNGISNKLPCLSHIQKYRNIYKLSVTKQDDLFKIYTYLYKNKKILKLVRKKTHFKYVLETLKNAKLRQFTYVKREQNPRVNNENYILKLKNIHGNKYDYSNVNFINNNHKIIILCPKHGEFQLLPNKHINGRGCPRCTKEIKYSKLTKTTEMFIDDANAIHNNRYDYLLTNYVNSRTKININCLKHGEFSVLPNHHLRGSGCPKCDAELKRKKYSKGVDYFIKKSKEVHGDRYDYSLVEYINIRTKVKLICPIHGIFEQYPYIHLRGSGCKECSYDKKKRS